MTEARPPGTSSRRVARNASLQAAAETISKVAALLLYAVLARQLGQAGFGAFAFAFSLGSLLLVLAAPGVNDVLTREVARDRAQLPRVLWAALGLRSVLGLTAVGLACLVALAGDYPAATRWAVLLLGLTMWVETVTKVLHATFVAFEDSGPVATSLLIQRVVGAFGAAGIALAGGGLVAVSAALLAAALLGSAYAARRFGRDITWPRPSWSPAAQRQLFVTALPLGITAVFTAILFRVDTVLLSLLDTETAVGLYAAAFRLLDATLFLSFSLGSVMLPVLSRLGPASAPTLGEVFTVGAKVLAILLFPAGAVCALYAEPIMALVYGRGFAEGDTALRLLGGTMALYGISYLSATTLVAQDDLRRIPVIAGVGAVVNVSLNLALIPVLSFTGAALATTITEAGRSLVLLLSVRRHDPTIAPARIFGGPLVGCGAMVLVWLALGEHLWAVPVAGVAYLVTLGLAERALQPGDLAQVATVLRQRRLPGA